MPKGAQTRTAILDHATGLASQVGLTGLTIGVLADDLKLSKSGLFAHPRGAARVRALFERWLKWARDAALPGGCVFVAATAELDDRPGPVRERLVELQRDWVDAIAISFTKGIEAGLFRKDADPRQLAQDMYGIMLSYHLHTRLLGDRNAGARARHAFDRLLEDIAT